MVTNDYELFIRHRRDNSQRDLSRYADYTISLTADEEMLRSRLIRRKMKTGMSREDVERFVESGDMRNVRLCLDKTMKADLELSV